MGDSAENTIILGTKEIQYNVQEEIQYYLHLVQHKYKYKLATYK